MDHWNLHWKDELREMEVRDGLRFRNKERINLVGKVMTITAKQRQEMLEAATPLIKWLNENCNPHCQAVVDSISVLVMEGVAMNRTEEFLKDR